MSRTADCVKHTQGQERSIPNMREVSDTESIDHEYFDRDAEVSDAETIDHAPTDLEEPGSTYQDVFGTTELLEHIISFLPVKDLRGPACRQTMEERNRHFSKHRGKDVHASQDYAKRDVRPTLDGLAISCSAAPRTSSAIHVHTCELEPGTET